MKSLTLEERIQRLEELVYKESASKKNEFLDFGKPKRSEEPMFFKKLCDKYSTIGSALSSVEKPIKNSDKLQFHLVLSTRKNLERYNEITFVIGGTSRSKMYCNALDENDNRIDILKDFDLYKDTNKVALFILNILQDNEKDKHESHCKLESISLSSMDCESIRQNIEDSLSDEYDSNVVVKVDSKYANLGIVVVDIYNTDLIAEYTITADDIDSFKTEYNGKVIGTISTLNIAVDNIVDHFLDNFIE